MILVFVIWPLAVFLVLALLRRGRVAAVGIVAAAVLGLVAWAGTTEDEVGEYNRFLLSMAFIGMGMAVLAQGVRLALPAGGPRWAYPLVLGGVVVLAHLAGLYALGGF